MKILSGLKVLSPRMKWLTAVLAAIVALKLLVPLSLAVAADDAAKTAPQTPQVTAAPAAKAPPKTTTTASEGKADYSEQGLLDAAYEFCATVQNRDAKSCDCEQKLLQQPERFGPEEREMAFYYFTDKDRYIKEFEARRTADANWHEDFALRMSNMQALVIAACGA